MVGLGVVSLPPEFGFVLCAHFRVNAAGLGCPNTPSQDRLGAVALHELGHAHHPCLPILRGAGGAGSRVPLFLVEPYHGRPRFPCASASLIGAHAVSAALVRPGEALGRHPGWASGNGVVRCPWRAAGWPELLGYLASRRQRPPLPRHPSLAVSEARQLTRSHPLSPLLTLRGRHDLRIQDTGGS